MSGLSWYIGSSLISCFSMSTAVRSMWPILISYLSPEAQAGAWGRGAHEAGGRGRGVKTEQNSERNPRGRGRGTAGATRPCPLSEHSVIRSTSGEAVNQDERDGDIPPKKHTQKRGTQRKRKSRKGGTEWEQDGKESVSASSQSGHRGFTNKKKVWFSAVPVGCAALFGTAGGPPRAQKCHQKALTPSGG